MNPIPNRLRSALLEHLRVMDPNHIDIGTRCLFTGNVPVFCGMPVKDVEVRLTINVPISVFTEAKDNES